MAEPGASEGVLHCLTLHAASDALMPAMYCMLEACAVVVIEGWHTLWLWHLGG